MWKLVVRFSPFVGLKPPGQQAVTREIGRGHLVALAFGSDALLSRVYNSPKESPCIFPG